MTGAPGALPVLRRELIGRTEQSVAVQRSLRADVGRMVTLSGTGGVGKTSLALHVAHALVASFADGVWFVDLADLEAGEDVALRCCNLLGLVDQQQGPSLVLARWLGAREVLLVLDNCEHVVDGAAVMVEALLDRCPAVRILATSRTRLSVDGERLVTVEPLPVPLPEADRSAIEGSAAVQLFAERATLSRGDFEVGGHLETVAEICRVTEGLPLALELAAAGSSTLDPADILARLVHGREPVRSRAKVTRQLSLDAIVEWSHRLLTDDQQRVYRRLAVFVGGFSLASADLLCSDEPGSGPPVDVTAALMALVDHSLVIRDATPEGSRFRLLMHVRNHAQRQLETSGERAHRECMHAEHFSAALQARASTRLPMVNSSGLDLDYRNCMAALRWAIREREMGLAFTLMYPLATTWRVHGLLREGVLHLDELLQALGPEPSQLRAASLGTRAHFMQILGRADEARADALATRDAAVAVGSTYAHAVALGVLVDLELDRGDHALALDLNREAGGLVETFPETLGAVRGAWLRQMGILAVSRGDLVAAMAGLTEARAVLERHHSWQLGRVLVDIARVRAQCGDTAAAVSDLMDAMRVHARHGHRVGAIECLDELALVCMVQGDAAMAAELFGAAAAIADATGFVRPASTMALIVQGRERARARLGEQPYDQAWRTGRELDLSQASALVERACRPGAPDVPAVSLTPREREVATLVAQGLTNKAIAVRLGIGHGTVRSHVERVLTKLGVSSRVQIARWVMSDGQEPSSVE